MKIGEKAHFSHYACDICGTPKPQKIIDGVVRGRSWALMCPDCHKLFGVGLGTGKGQLFEKQVDGTYVKVGG
jgi:hypothetical protein